MKRLLHIPNKTKTAFLRVAGWWVWPIVLVTLIVILILGNAASLQRLNDLEHKQRAETLQRRTANTERFAELEASQARQDRVIASINLILGKATPGVSIKTNGDIFIDPKSKSPLAVALRHDPAIKNRVDATRPKPRVTKPRPAVTKPKPAVTKPAPTAVSPTPATSTGSTTPSTGSGTPVSTPVTPLPIIPKPPAVPVVGPVVGPIVSPIVGPILQPVQPIVGPILAPVSPLLDPLVGPLVSSPLVPAPVGEAVIGLVSYRLPYCGAYVNL